MHLGTRGTAVLRQERPFADEHRIADFDPKRPFGLVQKSSRPVRR